MRTQLSIKLTPQDAASDVAISQHITESLGIDPQQLTGFVITRRSLDARGRQQWFLLNITAVIDEAFAGRIFKTIELKDVTNSPRQVIIAGAGPAGLFAALKLLEEGICPVVIERGKDVRARRRDLAALNKVGILNPESNYCFGEGGAGTYSDGKLYTRSTKRGDVNRILNILVQFGADERILYEAHPHIGTNKLPQIITAIRDAIISCGGKVLFETKLTDLVIDDHKLKSVIVNQQTEMPAENLILATGHSARDIFLLLHERKIKIEAKPYALGVRIEHPQELIDSIQYNCIGRSAYLPPAAYNLVQQVEGRGVFSFCMCPGGIIAPASTDLNQLVVNGWSPSKRNNAFANSGIVVTVENKDLTAFEQHGPLAGLHFQSEVEAKAFQHGGGRYVAPAQRMMDFVENKLSASLPESSYLPGLNAATLNDVLPPFVYDSLRKAFIEFGKKMKGYLTNEAVVVATESRTSSPVRIPRDAGTLQHPQIEGLYPCAEGAGYAGGIISAAMDGERVASSIVDKLVSK